MHDQGVIRLYDGWGTLVLSFTPTQFGDHKHCGSGDIMVLVSRVSLQEHMTKGLSNMGRGPSRLVTILPSLVVIGILILEICF